MNPGEHCPGCADKAAPISGGHEPWHRHLADGPAAPISGGGNRMVAFKPLGERGPTVYRDMTGIAPEHYQRLSGLENSHNGERLNTLPLLSITPANGPFEDIRNHVEAISTAYYLSDGAGSRDLLVPRGALSEAQPRRRESEMKLPRSRVRFTESEGHQPVSLERWPSGIQSCGWKDHLYTTVVGIFDLISDIPFFHIPLPVSEDEVNEAREFARQLQSWLQDLLSKTTIRPDSELVVYGDLKLSIEALLNKWIANQQKLSAVECEDPCSLQWSLDWVETSAVQPIDVQVRAAEDIKMKRIVFWVHITLQVAFRVGFTLKCEENKF